MKRILLLLFTFLPLISCDTTEENVIPLNPVYIELDLNFSDKELINLYGSKIFDKRTAYAREIGYGGVLVINGENNTLFAFDLCCPHDVDKNIKINPSDHGTASCPSCGTVYDTKYGTGMPESGPSKHTLLKYKVISKGYNQFYVTP